MKEESENLNNLKNVSPSLLENIKTKFFKLIFSDTSLLFRLLYHKYFTKEVYEEIKAIDTRKIASNFNLQNELRVKMKENLIFPSKKIVEEKLEIPSLENYDENKFDEFETEKKSKEYLKEYISICKFNWLNNFSTFSFFCLFGISCVFFNYHKKNKKLSNRMFMIIALQIILNVTSIYFTVRTHPDENFLQETYAKQLEKYKIILKE